MRKKIAVLLLLCAAGCNKPLPDYSKQPFDFSVTGITDVSVPANDLVWFSPSINVISGFAESQPVSVTLSGAPANVIIQKNNYSFLLNYTMRDSFGARNATPGTYAMQAVFSNASAGTKTYNFNLIVTAPIDRVAKVAGYYYPSNSCGANIYVSCEIDSLPGVPNGIMLIDRTAQSSSTYCTFDTCYGTVDCCSNTFMIPSQNVQGVTISGSGSFNGEESPYSQVILNRTFTTAASTYPCTVTLTQE